mgnify:CR=1 FL=1
MSDLPEYEKENSMPTFDDELDDVVNPPLTDEQLKEKAIARLKPLVGTEVLYEFDRGYKRYTVESLSEADATLTLYRKETYTRPQREVRLTGVNDWDCLTGPKFDTVSEIFETLKEGSLQGHYREYVLMHQLYKKHGDTLMRAVMSLLHWWGLEEGSKLAEEERS